MNDPILIVDDEMHVRGAVRRFLELENHSVEEAATGEEALRLLDEKYYPLMIIDLKLPGMTGLEVLARLQALHKKTEVIMMTGFGTIDTAVQAIRTGAFDFVTKPIDFNRLLITVRNAVEKAALSRQVDTLNTMIQKDLKLENFIGANLEMLKIFDTIRRVSDSDVNVVITGESGTGKEMIARTLHINSMRSKGPFLPVNCVSLSENLLESELFGHERGAFTGAVARKIGYFEAAQGGSIFLDEIGDLPLPLQARLLRTLQEKTIQRVGSTELIPVDARIISATNKDLFELIGQGTFREDLYYRLNVLSIEIPPLRKRKDDLPLLVEHFIKKYALRLSKDAATLAPEAEESIMAYDWPGNVRELENVIQRAMALTENGQIKVNNLPPHLVQGAKSKSRPVSFAGAATFKEAKQLVIDEFEKEFLSQALQKNGGNVTRAAEEVGLGRTVMQRLLKERGLESRDFKNGN